MKILFVASNPAEKQTLLLEQEVTQIQRRLLSILPTLATLEFRSLPHIEPEHLFDELRDHPPDILHLSAHGANDGIDWTTEGKPLWIPSDKLEKLLRALPVKPRLVYLNSCDSKLTASVLANSTIDFAVGAEISLMNRNAIKSAVTFYDWLARGHSVQGAYDAAKAILDVLEGKSDTIDLWNRDGTSPERTQLRALPIIVARLPRLKAGPNKDQMQLKRSKEGYYIIEFGLLNCPADTVQVVFFTNEASFIDDSDESTLEEDLCAVEREQPWPRELWISEQWDAAADYRVFATGVRASGESFTISSSPSEALTAGIEKNVCGQLSKQVRHRLVEIAAELRGSALK